MNDGFLKVAAATPAIRVADCAYNEKQIFELIQQAAARGAGVVVFPELCITGYTCGDLFRDRVLLAAAQETLCRLIRKTENLKILAVVGLPLPVGADLYNAAAVFCGGKLLGFAAKSSIPNYVEFYEARYFTPSPDYTEVSFGGETVPLGNTLIFPCRGMPEFVLGVEICEDLWVAVPPSSRLAQCGATLLANCSASDEIIGKAPYRRGLVGQQSGHLLAAYVYADAGEGESSTDLVYAGHNLIAENGTLLAESSPFQTGLTVADVDLERMVQERLRTTTWSNAGQAHCIPFDLDLPKIKLERKFPATPFVPGDVRDLSERCEMILNLQACGLKTRLRHTGSKCVSIGVSGGLDSTLALLVIARAFDLLGLDRKGIQAVSMPGFGTTARTKSNAQRLAELLGATYHEIPIHDAVNQHFRDIEHNPAVRDVTYENSQARERTQVLMDIANQCGCFVIGTGDLSELALGWATFNGDIMSMYGVNCSIPKTLVRHLVHHAAVTGGYEIRALLEDVLDTPVSPELLPPVNGEIAQKTEDIVGPYELHDFFLYYMVRFGFHPGKIYRMAQQAFAGTYDDQTIKKWLKNFYRRFFMNQFKRSCLPDGPKVGSVSLSPRGDWRMPSDASARLWLDEIETL
ncbi:MAG: NAD(+) synthase [Clostridiales bacterium]|nr:NAD(+) synthase [Clostridiales bacterium]